MADNIEHPAILAIFGNIGMVFVFTFIGPLPFVPVQTTVALVFTCVAIFGMSLAFVAVSTFSRAQVSAAREGFQIDTETYYLISGNSDFRYK